MQIKAKAGQRQAIIIVGQSFLAQAHVGQRWSWRAKGFKLGPGNQRCVFKSEKSGREIQEIWPKKNLAGGFKKNPAPGARGSKRFRGPGVPKDSGGPGFQSSRGHAGVPEVPGGPGFRDDRLYYSMCEVSVFICKMFLFICKMVFAQDIHVQDVASQMNMPRFMCIQYIRVLTDGLG